MNISNFKILRALRLRRAEARIGNLEYARLQETKIHATNMADLDEKIAATQRRIWALEPSVRHDRLRAEVSRIAAYLGTRS